MSAAFRAAITRTLAAEGGYVSHPLDRGGTTNWGLSRRFLEGATDRQWSDEEIRALTRDHAVVLYKLHFWDALELDALPATVAAKLFDLAVNVGQSRAVVLLQRALRAAGEIVADDGKLGPKTRAAVIAAYNAEGATALLAALRVEQANHYRRIVAADASQGVFLKGWLRRAYDESH